ncbi:MAG TPA: rhodanese-like domain-containing protein [Mucilaginibacter sp.]|nr:rhodanese-like domain-containing protein [Mucilaginibacter sp.]
MSDISAGEMLTRLKNTDNLNLLDVRERIEYYTYNIGGINIPLKSLNERINTLPWNKSDEIIVICSAGLRSATAKHILGEHGFNNARNLKGGLKGLQKLQHQ